MMSPSRTNNINSSTTPNAAAAASASTIISHHRRSSRNSSTASTNTTVSGTGRRCLTTTMPNSDMLQNKLRSLLNAPPSDGMSDMMSSNYDKYMSPKKLNQEVYMSNILVYSESAIFLCVLNGYRNIMKLKTNNIYPFLTRVVISYARSKQRCFGVLPQCVSIATIVATTSG